MSDAALNNWLVPFPGEFVRAILAEVGASVEEPGSDVSSTMMSMERQDQPVPHMAPPMLVHNAFYRLNTMRRKGSLHWRFWL